MDKAERDVSQAHIVTIPLIVTTIICVVLTLMRMYVRIWMIKLVGWDDFFNVLAMVSTSRPLKNVNIINGLVASYQWWW